MHDRSRPRGWRSQAAACFCAVALAACGGGGGGGGDAGVTAPAGASQALTLTAQNLSDVVYTGVGSAESLLQTAQLAVDTVQRRRASEGASLLSETCPNGGLRTVDLQDRDGNGRLSAGDGLVVGLRDCGIAGLEAVFDGTFTVSLTTLDPAPSEVLRGSLDLGSAGVVLSDPFNPTPGVTVRLSGSLAFEWKRTEIETGLRAFSTAADDLRLSGSGNGRTVTDAYRSIDLARTVRYDEARVTTTLALRVDSEAEGGSLSLSTPLPLKAYLNTFPDAGRLEIRGAGAAVIRVKPHFVTASEQFDAELDTNGDGAAETTVATRWQDASQGYLWWDGLQTVPWAAAPFSTQAFVSTDFRSFGFQPGTPSVNEVFRLQFNRPALATPIAMRFRDDSGLFRPDLSSRRDVPAKVVQQGALYLITPTEQLQHGRNYTLEISSDGVDWGTASITVRDTLNNATSLFGALGYFTTADNLKAVITPTSQLLNSAAASLQLSAAGSVSTLRPIVSYRWTQLGGTPLVFSAPDAAETRVQWGAAPPNGLEAIVVELTVTDAAGEFATSRVTLNALDAASAGSLLYFRGAAGDYISGGQTVLVAGGSVGANQADGGYFTYNYSDAATFWFLSLATADGAPFRVGAYENAIRAPFRGQQPGIELAGAGRGCNQIYGRFDVLELRTDAQGAITQIAVDFEQHCDSPQAPALFGSLRLNSSLPIRP